MSARTEQLAAALAATHRRTEIGLTLAVDPDHAVRALNRRIKAAIRIHAALDRERSWLVPDRPLDGSP